MTIAVTVMLAALGTLATATSATAGRMVATGEVADVACDVDNSASACHLLRVALDYVRTGAPNPGAPILLFDEPPNHMLNAIKKAYGGTPPFSIDEHAPSSTDFTSISISTAQFSAIVVASDYTCGTGNPCGDLNPNTYGQINPSPSDPCYANDPFPAPQVPFELTCFTNDSDALIAPPGHNAINRFYDAGGGILAGSGGDNGDGHAEDLYYDFLGVPRGLLFNGDPSAVSASGAAIGFSAGDFAHSGLACPAAPSFDPTFYLQCPYDAFFPLPAGSSLRVAEADGSGDPVTLFQDTDAPRTTITSQPPPLVVSRGPVGATFTFSASENFVSFQCRLDSGSYLPCSSPQSYANLGEGDHVFSVRAIDAAGNVEAAPPASLWLNAFDRDGDRWTRFSNPPDCNDTNAAIHPGAFEPPGGHVDIDCDGIQDPFPVIRPHVSYTVAPGRTSTRFDGLSVLFVPVGATVNVSCASVKRCPFRRASVVARRRGGTVDLSRIVRGSHMPVGSQIVIRVTQRFKIGSYVALTIRRGAVPRQSQQCLNPGGGRPQAVCPRFH